MFNIQHCIKSIINYSKNLLFPVFQLMFTYIFYKNNYTCTNNITVPFNFPRRYFSDFSHLLGPKEMQIQNI